MRWGGVLPPVGVLIVCRMYMRYPHEVMLPQPYPLDMTALDGLPQRRANRNNYFEIRSPISLRREPPSSVSRGFTPVVAWKRLKMTPDKPEELGTLWSRSTIATSDFSLEWKFRISG